MSSHSSESPSDPTQLSRKEQRMARIREGLADSPSPAPDTSPYEGPIGEDLEYDPEDNLLPPEYDIPPDRIIQAGLNIPDSVLQEHKEPDNPLATFDSAPGKEDVDIDTSVLSNLDSMRTRMDMVAGDLLKKDEKIDSLLQQVSALKTAMANMSTSISAGSPDNFSDVHDVVGRLAEQVKEMRIELTAISARNQEQFQLYEIKQAKEASQSVVAPIHAVLTDVPLTMTTPGDPVVSDHPVAVRTRRRAVLYDD